MKPRIHIALARRFRQAANAPEEIAWDARRTLRKLGYPMRRQHQIGPFVADFAVTRAKLAVEIDGGVHRLKEMNDSLREKEIRRRGWRVLRIPAESAMSRRHVLALVQQELRI